MKKVVIFTKTRVVNGLLVLALVLAFGAWLGLCILVNSCSTSPTPTPTQVAPAPTITNKLSASTLALLLPTAPVVSASKLTLPLTFSNQITTSNWIVTFTIEPFAYQGTLGIWASTNLVHWTNLGYVTISNKPIYCTNITLYPKTFYRLGLSLTNL